MTQDIVFFFWKLYKKYVQIKKKYLPNVRKILFFAKQTHFILIYFSENKT